MSRETVKTYMGRFALGLPTYKALCEVASSVMPPAQEQRTDLEPFVAITTQEELATRLKVGRPAVARALLLLMNGGWIARAVVNERGCWRLGSRRGSKLTLIADVQAFEATGAEGLVSGMIADLPGALPPSPVPSATPEVRRGGGRRWG